MPLRGLFIPRSSPSNRPFVNRMPLAIRPYAKWHTIVRQGAYDLMAIGISLAKHPFSSLKPPVSQPYIVRYTVSYRTM